MQTVEPYSRLAEIYDFVMRHVDYSGWADYIQSIFMRHSTRPPCDLLDVACGTGTLVQELARRGYRVSGSDSSASMVRQARLKSDREGSPGRFECASMSELSGICLYDAVLCLYDSVNYLMTPEDFEQALVRIHGLLRPLGLFVFDICTERNCILYFSDWTDRERTGSIRYVRRSRYHPKTRTQSNCFTMTFGNDGDTVVETHCQRIYSEDEVRSFVSRSGFGVVAVYDGFTLDPGSDQNSDRLHFVLQREQRS